MILTNCAACAAPLAHDAPRCVRCETRYCSATCQQDHCRRGHEQICELIHRGGGAEHYHADQKYKEAVAVAVEACAEDAKGQTCYICMEAVHSRTGEGVVRGCACRGTAGFAHVSCLAEQAKVVVADAEERNLSNKVKLKRFERWRICGLCEQQYHGVVACALGWACWKTYLGRPETDPPRQMAMNELGNGLGDAKHHEDALSVHEAVLSMMRRVGADARNLLVVQGNLAITHDKLGRCEEALEIKRDVYSGWSQLYGEEHERTLRQANNYASSLFLLQRFEEAKALLRRTTPVARRVVGDGHILTLKMRWIYAKALYKADAATLDDLRGSVATLEDLERTARRVLGSAHPFTMAIERELPKARAALRARETPSSPPPSGSV